MAVNSLWAVETLLSSFCTCVYSALTTNSANNNMCRVSWLGSQYIHQLCIPVYVDQWSEESYYDSTWPRLVGICVQCVISCFVVFGYIEIKGIACTFNNI